MSSLYFRSKGSPAKVDGFLHFIRLRLQHRFPLEREGCRVFSPARGGIENAGETCIVFDQLPVFFCTQLNLDWKWLCVGLMVQLPAVDRSSLQWQLASPSLMVTQDEDSAYRCKIETLAEPCEVEDKPSLS
jgi:hypothetical protein